MKIKEDVVWVGLLDKHLSRLLKEGTNEHLGVKVVQRGN